jgi:hypothetical protein
MRGEGYPLPPLTGGAPAAAPTAVVGLDDGWRMTGLLKVSEIYFAAPQAYPPLPLQEASSGVVDWPLGATGWERNRVTGPGWKVQGAFD